MSMQYGFDSSNWPASWIADARISVAHGSPTTCDPCSTISRPAATPLTRPLSPPLRRCMIRRPFSVTSVLAPVTSTTSGWASRTATCADTEPGSNTSSQPMTFT